MTMQVSDDVQLLELMLQDSRDVPELYKPTNYWANYEKKFIPELYSLGLKNFRRRKNSVLESFGAVDVCQPSRIDIGKLKIFNNRFINHALFKKILSPLNSVLNKLFPISNLYDIEREDLRRLVYTLVQLYSKETPAKSLANLTVSMVGNPEDIFKMHEKQYTMRMLNCYRRYAYCSRYINFDTIETVVELGCGHGAQVEVIKKLHPHICFLLFDLSPQLYVCEQYLKTIFSEAVISYRDTRSMKNLPTDWKGKIFIFGAAKFPLLEKIKIDLFWNAASFQEMEPPVVQNYLKYINQQAGSVFLQQVMGGKEKAKKKGMPGVLEQTKLEHYRRFLSNFNLIDLSPSLVAPRLSKGDFYMDSFWKRCC